MINAIQAFGVIMKKRVIIIFAVAALVLVAAACLAGCNKNVTVTFELPIDSTSGLDGKNVYTTVTQAKDTSLVFPANPISDTIGMEFEGWYDSNGNRVDELVLTKDVTLYGKWKKVEHSITYDLKGYGEMLPNAQNPSSYVVMEGLDSFYAPYCTVEGYQFGGWYDKDGKQWTSIPKYTNIDLALTANWVPVPYTISYYNVLTGAIGNSENPTTYNITQEVTFKDIRKIGYNFLGWYDGDGEDAAKITGISRGSTGNLKLYAKWELITYTISYDLACGRYEEGETNPDTYNTETGIVFAKPVKEGYAFKGWLDQLSGKTYNVVNKGNVGNLQLVAQWDIAEYTLYFDLQGGKYKDGESNPEYYTYFQSVNFVNPVKDGYTFGGWKDYETGEIVTGIPEGESRERAFVAVWIEA